MTQKELKVIGRTEKVDFPEFQIEGLEIKIDTGAYTSSLHCCFIEHIDGNRVAFIPLEPEDELYIGKKIILPIEQIKEVKSSNGITEERIMIKTSVKLFQENFDIFLTLTDRGDMKYPVLLGRKFISGKFLVDVRKRRLSNKKN